MKVKIVKANGLVTISVQRPCDTKPAEVVLNEGEAKALSGLLSTAANATIFSIELETK